MKRIINLVVLVISIMGLSFPAFAQKADDIKTIENYLNNIKTLSASFVQTASNGNTTEGKIYISKPNKIRMEYEDPVNVDIIGDGHFVVYNDKELEQVTHIDYDDIPATLILANDIKINGKDIKLIDFYKDSGTTEAVLEYQIKGESHPITLVFNNAPFALKQWRLTDPQGIEITVSLYNIHEDESLSESLFKYKENKTPQNRKTRR